MVYFVGAGSGAVDLITVRGKNLLEQADVIIYAGSLVNPELLDYKKEGCMVYNSAKNDTGGCSGSDGKGRSGRKDDGSVTYR